MVDKKFLVGSVLILSVILFLGFVFAVTTPTGLTFEQNTTSQYDKEGNFTLNWSTSDDSAVNFTIYIYSDDVLFASVNNDSATGYSFSNSSDANYTFTVEGENATGVKTNSSNISMIVDTTSPSISYNSNTESNDSGANRDWIFVNVSASDDNNDSIIYELWNDTSLVFRNVTDSTTINWTSLSKDVKYTFNVSMNDSATNSNSVATRTFYLDGTNPSASASCDDISRGDDLDCSCSTSDNLKLDSTSTSTDSSDGTGTQNSAGTFTFTCSATDNAGNSASSSASYTVSSSGGGGSPVSYEWSSQKIHSFLEMVPGEVFVVEGFDEENSLRKIEIEVNNNANDVKFTVRKYDSKPDNVSVSKSGKVNQYLEINTENIGENLGEAVVRIRVEKSWLMDNGVDRDNVALFKFDEGNNGWIEVSTSFVEEDNNYYYYESVLESFSYFAIGEKSSDLSDSEDSGDVSGEEIEDSEGVSEGEGSSSNWWIWVIVVVAVIVLIYFLNNKKLKGKLFK